MSNVKVSQINGGVAVAPASTALVEYETAAGVSEFCSLQQVHKALTDGANVATSESLSSSTYGDLATSGPAVTMTTGTDVIVSISATISRPSGTGNSLWVSVAVSGATTLAASDANSAVASAYAAGYNIQLSRRLKITGLTAGSNTFTMKYRTDGGTWNVLNRSIVVEAI